jgi:hypothetical protein
MTRRRLKPRNSKKRIARLRRDPIAEKSGSGACLYRIAFRMLFSDAKFQWKEHTKGGFLMRV